MPLPLGQNTRAYKFTGITIITPRMGYVLLGFGTFYATSEVVKMNKSISILTMNYSFSSILYKTLTGWSCLNTTTLKETRIIQRSKHNIMFKDALKFIQGRCRKVHNIFYNVHA